MIEMFRDIKEGVDADVPVDAQNAPTGTWKTADSFPQAPTPVILSQRKNEERTTQSAEDLNDLDPRICLDNGVHLSYRGRDSLRRCSTRGRRVDGPALAYPRLPE